MNSIQSQLRKIGRRLASYLGLKNGKKVRPIKSQIHPVYLPLAPNEASGWKPYPCYKGLTKIGITKSCHVSVLMNGCCPHPPHTHKEEEILLVLQGEVELNLPADTMRNKSTEYRLLPGQFAYYPAFFPHTLKAVSSEPAIYLMFKWSVEHSMATEELPFTIYNLNKNQNGTGSRSGFSLNRVFEGATRYLKKLHCHVSTLEPGGGYSPHADPYDVAILVLEGEVETLGKRVRPHGIIYYAPGEKHGMHNPGQVPARYVVFEFHRPIQPSRWTKIWKLRSWRKKLRQIRHKHFKSPTALF